MTPARGVTPTGGLPGLLLTYQAVAVGYCSHSFTSLDNPYFPREEWEEAKRTMPQDIFRQEYEAQFQSIDAPQGGACAGQP